MVEPRFIEIFLVLYVSRGVSDSCLSSRPSFTLVENDILDDNALEEDDTSVAENVIQATDPLEVENLLRDIENEPWFSECFLDKEVEKDTKEYAGIDVEMLRDVDKGGKDKSKKQTNWARTKFDGWRRFAKKSSDLPFPIDLSIAIEDIPDDQLNEMLVRFMIQVRKKDGSMFPAGSLNSLLKAIGKILRKNQESKTPSSCKRTPDFNILRDRGYIRARAAFVAAADRSRKLGIGVSSKKAQAIPFNSERDLLEDIDFQINTPKGVQRRLCFYLCTRFAIRGASELYEVKDVDLTLESDGASEYILYNERTSKTWGTTVMKYDPSHFRPPIWSFEENFVLTYKQYVRHLPVKENSAPRPFFLQAISNFKSQVWFQKGRVGCNNISKWIRNMGAMIDVEICNKSGRVSTVTRMSMAGVPPEVGKLITGHRRTESYQKYDRSKEIQVNAAMSINSKPYNDDGTLRLYSDVLNEMIKNKENTLLGSRSGKCLTDKPSASGSSSDQAILTEKQFNIPVVSGNDGVLLTDNRVASSSDAMICDQQNVVSDGSRRSNQIQVSGVKAVDDEDKNLVDYWAFEEFLKSNPQLHKYFPPTVEVKNVGGHSFVGATFNNCTFIQVPDSTTVPLMLERGNSGSGLSS